MRPGVFSVVRIFVLGDGGRHMQIIEDIWKLPIRHIICAGIFAALGLLPFVLAVFVQPFSMWVIPIVDFISPGTGSPDNWAIGFHYTFLYVAICLSVSAGFLVLAIYRHNASSSDSARKYDGAQT